MQISISLMYFKVCFSNTDNRMLDVGEEGFMMGRSGSPKNPIIGEKYLKGVSAIHFDRQALVVSELCIITLLRCVDRGLCVRAYLVQDHRSSLVFAKVKVAPLKYKNRNFSLHSCWLTILNDGKEFLHSNLATHAEVFCCILS